MLIRNILSENLNINKQKKQELQLKKSFLENAQDIIKEDCKICRQKENLVVRNKDMSKLLTALGDCWTFSKSVANDFNEMDGKLQAYGFDKMKYNVMFEGKINLLIYKPNFEKRKMLYLANREKSIKKIEVNPIIFIAYFPEDKSSFSSRMPAGQFDAFKEQNRITMNITLSQFLYQYIDDFLLNINREILKFSSNATS